MAEVSDKRSEKRFDLLANNFAVVGEGHFAVELIKIAVKTVGPWVFVAETRGDLKIFVDATNHEELLELLRGLRKGVELAGMKA